MMLSNKKLCFRSELVELCKKYHIPTALICTEKTYYFIGENKKNIFKNILKGIFRKDELNEESTYD